MTIAAKNEEIDRGLRDGQFDIVAGTPWLFARPELEGLLDVLTVDEAGQMSLANVVVMGGAARSIVLLGDPNQLAQVTQGTHPDGADKSALEHAVGDNPTLPPDRGLFLAETRRLHPSVCSYVSEVFYEGRLQPHPSTHQQEIADGPTLRGAGLRFSGVPHAQNEVRSAEEAERVADFVGGGEKPRNSDGRRSSGERGGSGWGQEAFLFGDEGPQLSGDVVDVVWIG